MPRIPNSLEDPLTPALVGEAPRRARRKRSRLAPVVTTGVVLLTAGAGILTGSFLIRAGQGSTPEPSVGPTPSVAAVASPSPSPVLTTPVVGGWYAGASGLGVADGAFEKWLKQPVTVAATWADHSATVQTRLTPLATEYADWDGAIDIAVGGTVLGSSENYRAAATGAYDKRWRAAAARLSKLRGTAKTPTFVRPFHEMNGDWFDNWAVTADNAADYRAAHARYTRILRAAMPQVYISWSPNSGDHSGLPVQQWYPGDDVVDCVAPDYYDDTSTQARYDVAAWNTEAGEVDDLGNPHGPEAWRQFALAHGKPLCFPETGLKPSGGSVDHPQWIKAFNLWLNEHANTSTWHLGEPIPSQAAGKVLYSVYFNVSHGGLDGFTIHGRDANPKSEKMFRSLTWGRQP